MDKLLWYFWPGNVRELESAVERALVLLVGEYASERELTPAILQAQDGSQCAELGFSNMTLEGIKRIASLGRAGSHRMQQEQSRRRLGITRKTLHAKFSGMIRHRR